jgi:exosortase
MDRPGKSPDPHPPAPARATAETTTDPSRPGDNPAVPLFLALIWGQLFWALHPSWSHSQYYDYGWVIPPLAAWFFHRRWSMRTRFPRSPNEARSILSKTVLVAAGFVLLFFLLTFLRVLERFDTIWRIPLLVHALVVFVFTHAALWLKQDFRFSFAYLPLTLFALTAVPWPAQIETLIVGEMTDQLLAFSAPLSRALGLDVVLSGSALISDGRVIEIDEGCSGIRSFQSLLMAGLFVGEFMGLRWGWRALLVLLATIFGFVTNTIRASALSWIFIHHGQLTFDHYHDLFGLLSFGLAASMLLAAGKWMDRPLASNAKADTPSLPSLQR